MTLADLEELTEDTVLQDLDYSPPCELDGVHEERGVPVAAAELFLKLQTPCRCETPVWVLMCKGCEAYLSQCWGRCSGCQRMWPFQLIVRDRVPL